MCGIAGWFGDVSLPRSHADTIAGMLDRIRHRGPDGSGVASQPLATLGHLRLAIIDPAGGVQPVWSHDKSSVLVFNGEIYNFLELRSRLVPTSGAWRTRSDTEVLLELLRQEGPDALAKLRGMYAFAYWDATRKRGLLARDPCGIKPLFVRRERGGLWFASEAKAFPRTDLWSPSLDASQLHLSLNLRYSGGGDGLFEGVRQLAPGQCLEWTEHGEREWSIPAAPTPDLSPDGIRERVLDSVGAHIVSDVPVACYLSGGIDSAIVTFGARQAGVSDLQTFTIDAGDDPREADNAAATARWLGVENVRGVLAEATPDALTWLLFHLEVPKVNAFQSAAVAQLASSRVKVCLSGLGGDELFLGYRAHRWLEIACKAAASSGSLGRWLGSSGAAMASAFGTFSEPWRAASMLRFGKDVPHAYALLRNVWDGALPTRRIYGPRLLDQPLPDAVDWIRSRWPAADSPSAAMARFEWRNKMVDDLLWMEDRTSMAFGLEARVPFVDERLRRSLEARNAEIARHPGTKRMLKQAFAADVPDTILRRPKSGFQLDISQAMDTIFGTVLSEWLSPERTRRHGLFNPQFVSELLRLRRARRHRWHFFLLMLMAQAHRWIELFETGEASVPAKPNFVLSGS